MTAPAAGRLQSRSFGAGVITFVLLLAGALAPLPYVIEYPGPTINVLGDYQGRELIQVADEQETGGPLRMTTVTVSGLPGDAILAMPLSYALFNPDLAITPRELLYPDNQSAEENREISAAQMNSSQENASIAALESMGTEVPVSLEVAGTAEGAAAADVVEVGDVLTSISAPGKPTLRADSYRKVIALMAGISPGTEVSVTVRRDGADVPVTFTTIAPPTAGAGEEQRSGSLLGLALYAHPDRSLGIDFGVGDRIGGPSAGLMFALGIIDKLTPGPLAGDRSVAGTGTMALDGAVGPIGGIRQKMVGAKRDGAQYFLIPADNCAEAAGHVPDGMQGVRVERLDDALAAVEKIADGRSADLPACRAG